MSALIGLLTGAVALYLLYLGVKKGGITKTVSLCAGGAFWLTAVFTGSLLYSLLVSAIASIIPIILKSERFKSSRDSLSARAKVLQSRLSQALNQTRSNAKIKGRKKLG